MANSTTGGDQVGWVWPDSRRNTWNIIVSCLTVFIICSWKATHLNIPTVAESQGVWHEWRGVPCVPQLPLLLKCARKLLFMVIIAIAPEVVVSLSLRQYLDAKADLRDVGPEYTLTHAFFANMGGFVLRVQMPTREDPAPDASVTPSKRPAGNENVEDGKGERLDHFPRERFLTLRNFAGLQESGFLFSIAEEDIKDRSKADTLTKIIALSQSGWLVVQSIGRAASGLSITKLELMTMAFVFCALPTYVVWWHKPFNVARSYVFDCPEFRIGGVHLWDEREVGRREFNDYRSSIQPARVPDISFDIMRELVEVKRGQRAAVQWAKIALYLTGAAFSAIHLAAWNWEFPSPIIQALWRWFAVVSVAGSMGLMLIVIFHFRYVSNTADDRCFIVPILLSVILLFAYIVSRLALIILTFYCFKSMPASVYEELDWTRYLPHFS